MLSRHTRISRGEERYRSPIAATAQLVWTTDAEGNVVEDIPGWRAFTGQTEDEIKGHGWINALHPEDRGPTAAVWAQAVKMRSYYATEYRIRRHDGAYCHFMVCGLPILKKDGGIREWVGTCTNITEWKQAEADLRQEQNARLQFEISHREQVEESLRERRQELDEAQRLARVGSWVWELEPERVTWSEEMCYIFGHHSKYPVPCFREQQRFFTSESWSRLSAAVERALQKGTPYQLDLEIVRANGQRAWITARGEAQRDAGGRIVRLRGTMQDITGRKLAEEELQWRTAFFEALVHGCFDGILVVDSHGKKILQNRRTVELWELPPSVVADPDDEKQVQFVVTQRVKYPEKFFIKVSHLYSNPNEISRDEVELKSGTVLDRYSSPVVDKAGKYYGRIWSFRDITERKRAEEALKKARDTLEQRVQERTAELKIANEHLARTNRLLHILSKCNEQLVHARDESELLREICQVIVGPGGYPAVWIGFAEEDEAKTVRPMAHEGFEPGYLDRTKVTWAEALLGRGPTGTAIRSGGPSIVRDIRTSVDFAPWREEAVRRGYASVIGLPLRGRGRVFGSLTIYAPTSDAFPPVEVGALMELADDLAYGIISLRAREERKKAESELRRLAELQSAILNNTTYMVISTDEKGIITSINPAGERALGYTTEECVGRLIPTVFHDPGETAERARIFSKELGITIEPGFEVYVARARRDLPNDFEWTYVRKDGSQFPVLLSVTALRDAQRNIIGFLGLANDITERKRAEEELHRSEQKFATIFHGSPVALSVSEYDTGRLVEQASHSRRIRRSSMFSRT